MKLAMKDIIALTMAGYKKKDIDELMKLYESEETETPKEKEKEEPKEAPKEEPKEEPKEKEKEDPKEEPVEDQIDYKKLYEEEKNKRELLQKENLNKDIDDNRKSDEDILKNLVKDFM